MQENPEGMFALIVLTQLGCTSYMNNPLSSTGNMDAVQLLLSNYRQWSINLQLWVILAASLGHVSLDKQIRTVCHVNVKNKRNWGMMGTLRTGDSLEKDRRLCAREERGWPRKRWQEDMGNWTGLQINPVVRLTDGAKWTPFVHCAANPPEDDDTSEH